METRLERVRLLVQATLILIYNFEPNIFRRQRRIAAASAKSQSRKVAIFGFIEALGTDDTVCRPI